MVLKPVFHVWEVKIWLWRDFCKPSWRVKLSAAPSVFYSKIRFFDQLCVVYNLPALFEKLQNSG